MGESGKWVALFTTTTNVAEFQPMSDSRMHSQTFCCILLGAFLVYVCVCVEYIHLYREQTIALCLSNLFAGICFPRRLYAAIIVYANWHK